MADNNVIIGAQVGNKDYQFQDETLETRVADIIAGMDITPSPGQAPNLTAVINNVNLLAEAHNELLGKLAKLAYNTDNVPGEVALTWPEQGDEPAYVAPELYSPALNSVIDLGVVAVGDSSVTRTITFRGSTGIVQDILLSINNDSRFALSTSQLRYQDVINGTASVAITYSGEDANAECILLVTGGVTGTITLRASIAAEDDVMHSVTASLEHCSLSNSGDVKEGDMFNANLVPDEGYAFTGLTIPVVTMGGDPLDSESGTIGYNQMTGNWNIHIDSVTGDIGVTASAVNVHKVNVNKTGCTYTGQSSVIDGGNVVLTFTPSGQYTMEGVVPTISGTTISNDVTLLSNDSLRISLYGVSSDVTVTVNAKNTAIGPDINPDDPGDSDLPAPCHKYLQRLDSSTPGDPNYEGLPIMQDEVGDVDLYNKKVFSTISTGYGNTKRVNNMTASVDDTDVSVPTNGQSLLLLADQADDGFSVLIKNYSPSRNANGMISGTLKNNIWISFTDARGSQLNLYRRGSSFDPSSDGHFLFGVKANSSGYLDTAHPFVAYYDGESETDEYFTGKGIDATKTWDILFTFEKETNEVKAYVDGELAGSAIPTADLVIRGLNIPNNISADGGFSHSGISFFNKVLTQEEIAALS